MIDKPPYITIIVIGDELLSGNTIDSNSHFLSRLLVSRGYVLNAVVIVGDTIKEIVRVVRDALSRSDIIIVTGGLGPTPDDITRFAIAEALNRELILFKKERDFILKRLAHVNEKIRRMSEVESLLPDGCTPIRNQVGLAPGFRVQMKGTMLFCVPGVPSEAESMCTKNILPFIQRKFPPSKTMQYVLKTIGIGESKVYCKIRRYVSSEITVGFYPRGYEVELRIHVPVEHREKGFMRYKKIKQELADFLYAEDQRSIEEVLCTLFKKRKITFGSVESCTGGLISKRITDVAGSSSFFKGGIIAYSNELKKDLLGVKETTIDKDGAVSSSVARQMARGLSELLDVDLALSVTGIAGPTGATKSKPCGLTFIGLQYKDKVFVRKHVFKGDREKVRWLTSQAALHLVWQTIG